MIENCYHRDSGCVGNYTPSKLTTGPTRAGLVVFLSFDKIKSGREDSTH